MSTRSGSPASELREPLAVSTRTTEPTAAPAQQSTHSSVRSEIKLGTHRLCHSYATDLLQAGVDLRRVEAR